MLTFVLQLAVIYTPSLNPIFKTQPLTAQELAVYILLPALVLVVSRPRRSRFAEGGSAGNAAGRNASRMASPGIRQPRPGCRMVVQDRSS